MPTSENGTFSFYNDPEKVVGYIEMTKEFDGSSLIHILKGFLDPGARVLELGMGPGKDMDSLIEKGFGVTGSDISRPFLDLYLEKHPKADLMLLNAVSLDTDRKFDCIYSNKTMIHLNPTELKESLKNQHRVLNSKGLIAHSFWYGNEEWKGEEDENENGVQACDYTEKTLLPLIEGMFEMVEISRYSQFEDGDSMFVVMKKI